MQSTSGKQLRCPDQSLWSLIAEHVPESELPKIHAALGCSLVDMYTEVHAEAVMWHKIWQESQAGGSLSSRPGTPLSRQQRLLADPPAIKELVRAEIRMLLQNLKEKAIREGRLVMSGCNKSDLIICKYQGLRVKAPLDFPVKSKHDDEFLLGYKRETVAFAWGCFDTTTDPGDSDTDSRPSSHSSVQSNAEDEIESVKNKLNITDIEQVVDHIKSLLIEESEALKIQVKHIQGNIKRHSRSRCEFNRTEPSLAELKELRGAIQTDLKLYPTSSSSTCSPVSVTSWKNRLRLPPGQRISDEALQALTATSGFRPHPPPASCHVSPSPPRRPPLNHTSMSAKPINTSLSRTRDKHSSSAASTGPNELPTANYHGITASRRRNIHLATSGKDETTGARSHACSSSPDQDGAGIHMRNCSFQMKTQRNSSVHMAHLSSRRTIHSSSQECDLSLLTERKGSLTPRSENINMNPSPIPPLSPLRDSGNYKFSYSGNNTDHSVSSRGKSLQNSCSRGSSVSVGQCDNGRGSLPPGVKHSVLSSTGSHPAKKDTLRSNTEINRTNNDHLDDVNQQLSSLHLTDRTSHYPGGIQAACRQLKLRKNNEQFCTSSPKPQTEKEFFNTFLEPVPPPRVWSTTDQTAGVK